MRERPILFSGEMVRAILDGRKTQTRRVVKPQPPVWCDRAGLSALTPPGKWEFRGTHPEHGASSVFIKCPYLPMTETTLWVRETWQQVVQRKRDDQWFTVPNPRQGYGVLLYSATHDFDEPPRWRPSIHMPRWASRITLEITSVRVERLQEMSFVDWVADFCPSYTEQEKARETFTGWDNQRAMAKAFWDSINGKRCPWDSNPWVWRITFRRTER